MTSFRSLHRGRAGHRGLSEARTCRARMEPNAALRREALLAAAQRIFIARGYHAATMDEIAAGAGMSKRTLYQLVESKESLFAALLKQRQFGFDIDFATDDRPPEEVLFDIVSSWARHVLDPDSIALARLIMADYAHGATLSRLLERQTARPCKEAVCAYLAGLGERRRIAIDDPEEAAQMLLGMAIGGIHVGTLLGLAKAPGPAALDARIRRAVAFFLRGAQMQGSGV